jgi:small neutral amino acid transporter SnatA (MarC family)
MWLLHLKTGAVNVAGDIVLLLIILSTLAGPANNQDPEGEQTTMTRRN